MGKDDKKNALVIEIKGDMSHKANVATNLLSDLFSINYISSRSPSLHICLDAEFIINDLDYFQSSLAKVLINIPTFTIIGRGLGIFVAETPVVYIRWHISEKLLHFKHLVSNFLNHSQNEGVISNYSIDLNWIPKTTLAYQDTSYKALSDIISAIFHIDFSSSMDVDSLFTYEYSIKNGEKRLSTLQLKPG